METTLTPTWNDQHTTLTLTAQAEGADRVKIYAGYYPNLYQFEGEDELVLSDLPHDEHRFLYVRAVGLVGDFEQTEGEYLGTLPILHPVLGIVKTCDGDRNIVDFVEKKNGTVKRWIAGQRVVKISTFNVNLFVEGELYQSFKVCGGQPMADPGPAPDKEGCEFAYWGYKYEPPAPVPPAPSPTPPERTEFRVTYEPLNGQPYMEEWVKKGDKATPPQDPESATTGRPFLGWSVKTD